MATVAEVYALAWQHHQGGSFTQAEQLYRQVLQADPVHVDSLCKLAAICQARGNFAEAEAKYRRVIQLQPGHSIGHNGLGIILAQQGKLAEAASAFEQLILSQSNDVDAHSNLGLVRFHQGRPEESVPHYQRALQLRPDFAEAHHNLGSALTRLGKSNEAVDCFRRAIRLKPDFAAAHNNLAMALKDLGHIDESMAHLEQALRLQPNYADAHCHRALLLLLRGDFDRGWPEYARWAQPLIARRSFSQPAWDGSHLNGRTILLHAEQGLGDTIQFVRYVPLVKQRGGNVIVECQPRILPLLAHAEVNDVVVPRGSPLPAFDVQASLLSLPRIFHSSLASIPATVPYLHAKDTLVTHWERELKTLLSPTQHKAFKVGIAWQGNPTQYADRQRSMPLEHFSPLAQVKGARLFSLQKGPGVNQLRALAGRLPVRDLGNDLDEAAGAFMDTAAIMKNLDLVISSDTAIPHLAGALGVPVWVALPLVPDWRWLMHREDSPWYPTMRLFRQTRYGCWDDVFARIAEELRLVVA